ncbi:hypothetical protein, partial [Halioglobus sp. HI00S01]|uniref:hypothetical protein n=1 Tax=Halioglobus sp. HI00S01 TaxID=1822214 RepID=UPI0018D435C9
QSLIEAALVDGRLEFTGPLSLTDFSLDGVADGLVKAPSLDINGEMAVSNSTLQVVLTASADVTGNMNLSASQVTLYTAGPVTVGGDITLASGEVLTTGDGRSSSKTLYPLTLDVVG